MKNAAMRPIVQKPVTPTLNLILRPLIRAIMSPMVIATALTLGLPAAALFASGCEGCSCISTAPAPAADVPAKQPPPLPQPTKEADQTKAKRPVIEKTVVKIDGQREFDVDIDIPEGVTIKSNGSIQVLDQLGASPSRRRFEITEEPRVSGQRITMRLRVRGNLTEDFYVLAEMEQPDESGQTCLTVPVQPGALFPVEVKVENLRGGRPPAKAVEPTKNKGQNLGLLGEL